MKHIFLFLSLLLLYSLSNAQLISVTEGAVLNGFTLSETSGLMRFNQSIYVHNDSGGETALYAIDTLSGDVGSATFLNNATNVDWEDITRDDSYTYVGDFGNNLGNRTDLKIYKLSNDNLDQVTGIFEVIEFSYPEQSDFSEQLFTTNFDAEALVSWGDDLLLFTKNWGNQKTNVYRIPKIAGVHEAELLTEIEVDGFITGACYDPLGDYSILTGYTILEPFVFIIPEGDLFSEDMSRVSYAVEGGFQIEAIEQLEQNRFILTREGEGETIPRLFYLEVDWSDSILATSNEFVSAYPNPSQNIVHIGAPLSRWELHSDRGDLLMSGVEQVVSLAELPKGVYLLRINVKGGVMTHRLVKE